MLLAMLYTGLFHWVLDPWSTWPNNKTQLKPFKQSALNLGVQRSAGCYWIFFQLAKQATKKLASGLHNPCQMVKHGRLYSAENLYPRFTFGKNSMYASPRAYRIFCFHTGFLLQIYTFRVLGQRLLWGLSLTRRSPWSVQVRLKRIRKFLSTLKGHQINILKMHKIAHEF